MIRPVELEDAAALCALYNHYIANSIVTFEEQPVPVDEFRHRIDTIIESYPWLVSEVDGEIAGYVYAGPWKMRNAYRFSAETTVYLDTRFQGKGIGTALYEGLFLELRERDIHAVMAGIALPNDASVALHEKVGFAKVAHFEEVGRKFNKWIDVAYWELKLHKD
jgi:phosphinothricin acetyltransferase